MKKTPIDRELYDKLVELYRKWPLQHRRVAADAGVHHEAAFTLWHSGNRRRGFLAISSIVMDEQAEARARLHEQDEERKRKAFEHSVANRISEAEVLAADWKLLQAGTGHLVAQFQAIAKLGPYIQKMLAIEIEKERLSVREVVGLVGRVHANFRDMASSLTELMKAQRLWLGEPTAHVRVQTDEDAARWVRFAAEMSEEEFQAALSSGRLPERLGSDALPEGEPH